MYGELKHHMQHNSVFLRSIHSDHKGAVNANMVYRLNNLRFACHENEVKIYLNIYLNEVCLVIYLYYSPP